MRRYFMQKQEDITGKKYGSLTAIRWVKTERHITKSGREVYRNYWEFVCDCGKRKIARKTSVVSPCETKNKSCGCARNISKWKGHGQISGTYWNHLKRSAKKRGLEFSVTIQQAWDKFESQKSLCAISGVEIGFRPQTASLDRIDSQKGYVASNIQWTHQIANCMKWDLSQKELVHWCKLIVAHGPQP